MASNTTRKGYLFALPWIIGLGAFSLYPFLASLYYSFTDFSVLQSPKPVGLENFKEIMNDSVFWEVLKNTFEYAALSIPSGMIVALTLALLMNAVRRGQALYSVIFYLPILIPGTVSAILWLWIFNADCGLLNSALKPIMHIFSPTWQPPAWLSDTKLALPSLVFMGLWGTGQTAFIYLAKLQDVPQELYEAAEIDGASTLHKVWHITLPMISPLIFFNIVMGIIGAFQVFTEPFMMTEGGPGNATYFLPHYIWNNAFMYFRMGYACAMSWVLFLVILLLTGLAFRLSRDRVYYAGR